MKIHISNRQKDLSLTKMRASISPLVRAIIKKETGSDDIWDEMSLYFVTEKKICDLHDTFFNDPSPTDCISIPVDMPDSFRPRVLGELFICPKTALAYAKKHQTDPYKETLLYIVHGLLHLLGYDDIEPGDRKKMRQKERFYMKLIS